MHDPITSAQLASADIDVVIPPLGLRESPEPYIHRMLGNPPEIFEHGATYTGRPATWLYQNAQHVVKIRSEYRLAPRDARRWIERTARIEHRLQVHHPEKGWFLIHCGAVALIANLTPLMRPLHQEVTRISVDALCDDLERLLTLYLHTAAHFQQRLDEGLSNFAIAADHRLYYLDDDVYTWDTFISLTQAIGFWCRTLPQLTGDPAAHLGAVFKRLLETYFHDRHTAHVVADLIRRVPLANAGQKRCREAFLSGLAPRVSRVHRQRSWSRGPLCRLSTTDQRGDVLPGQIRCGGHHPRYARPRPPHCPDPTFESGRMKELRSMHMDTLLEVKHLTIGYGPKVILRDLSFVAPQRGTIALMGPSGVGKSSLLRAFGRWNDAQPIFWARGKIWLEGKELLDFEPVTWIQQRVPMLAQKARLYTGSVLDNVVAETMVSRSLNRSEREALAYQTLHPLGLWDEFKAQFDNPVMNLSMGAHKKILLARLLTKEARCLLVDEPFQDVSLAEEADLMTVLQRVAEHRLIILVTHNKHKARQLSDTVCLISGDRMVEYTPADIFFEQPRTELGKAFLRSGSSWPEWDEASASVAPPRSATPSISFPPEFHWILMGHLGGMQYPGLLGDVDQDLKGLCHLGVQVLINLTEMPFDSARLEAFGLQGEHYPIMDMSVPTLSQAERICSRIASLIQQQQPVVVHCKAGLGRTGTLLACVLVYRGMEATRAIEAVRTIKPGYIQTDEQLTFVATFEDYLESQKHGHLHRHQQD